MVVVEARVSAREWPPRADLTTPAHVCATQKCNNLNAGYGQEPSDGLRKGSSRRNTREVTLAGA